MMLKRQRNFRRAAEHVAEAIARHPAVHRIALFGSAAMPLRKEIPRFRQFRRAGIAIWHEPYRITLASDGWQTSSIDHGNSGEKKSH